MAEEEPDIVDSVTEATNGIGSEALAAISNLGGGSGSIATSVVSRIGATVSGQAGGFAPKAIITITKHGLAAIDRVEPIEGVDRGYRAVARDANGLESIRTVLDLDPREYDVTVTREDGLAIVEFVQQEPDPEPALPAGDEVADSATESTATPEPTAPVKDAGAVDRRNEPTTTNSAATNTTAANTQPANAQPANAPRPLGTDGAGHGQHASGQPVPASGAGEEVQRARAEAEKAKAQAEAEKARAEAEKAKAEAEAAKARAEAERVEAEADAEAARSERETAGDAARTLESADGQGAHEQPGVARGEDSGHDQQRESGARDRQRVESERVDGDGQFSAANALDTAFDGERRDGQDATETAGGWGLRDGSAGTEDARSAPTTEAASDETETDGDDDGEDGFGGFTPATPVEDEPPEYADGGAIETSISVHDDGTQDAVTDGGTDDEEDTGEFIF